ncbi:hypothetical protein Pelo_1943 [Pelomyxa schiedti]|nr:hypothetical protein Pelo_1943 [Pelomyxa schiedti]
MTSAVRVGTGPKATSAVVVTKQCCCCCGGRVYDAEKVAYNTCLAHKRCFTCGQCRTPLTVGKCAGLVEGRFFCKAHAPRTLTTKRNSTPPRPVQDQSSVQNEPPRSHSAQEHPHSVQNSPLQSQLSPEQPHNVHTPGNPACDSALAAEPQQAPPSQLPPVYVQARVQADQNSLPPAQSALHNEKQALLTSAVPLHDQPDFQVDRVNPETAASNQTPEVHEQEEIKRDKCTSLAEPTVTLIKGNQEPAIASAQSATTSVHQDTCTLPPRLYSDLKTTEFQAEDRGCESANVHLEALLKLKQTPDPVRQINDILSDLNELVEARQKIDELESTPEVSSCMNLHPSETVHMQSPESSTSCDSTPTCEPMGIIAFLPELAWRKILKHLPQSCIFKCVRLVCKSWDLSVRNNVTILDYNFHREDSDQFLIYICSILPFLRSLNLMCSSVTRWTLLSCLSSHKNLRHVKILSHSNLRTLVHSRYTADSCMNHAFSTANYSNSLPLPPLVSLRCDCYSLTDILLDEKSSLVSSLRHLDLSIPESSSPIQFSKRWTALTHLSLRLPSVFQEPVILDLGEVTTLKNLLLFNLYRNIKSITLPNTGIPGKPLLQVRIIGNSLGVLAINYAAMSKISHLHVSHEICWGVIPKAVLKNLHNAPCQTTLKGILRSTPSLEETELLVVEERGGIQELRCKARESGPQSSDLEIPPSLTDDDLQSEPIPYYAEIKCPNFRYGCPLVMPRSKLLIHLSQCNYYLIICKSCRKPIPRPQWTSHCAICNCPDYTTPGGNTNNGNINRRRLCPFEPLICGFVNDINSHLSVCPHYKVMCKVCGETFPSRLDLVSHQNSSQACQKRVRVMFW